MAFLYNAEVKFFLYLKQKSADPFFSLSFPAGHVFEFLTCFYFGNVSAFTVSVNPGASICPVIFILFKKIWYYNLSRDEVTQRKLSNVIIEILLRSDCTPVRLCFSLSLSLGVSSHCFLFLWVTRSNVHSTLSTKQVWRLRVPTEWGRYYHLATKMGVSLLCGRRSTLMMSKPIYGRQMKNNKLRLHIRVNRVREKRKKLCENR